MIEMQYIVLLMEYLVQGGIIPDRNGKWCKVGDKVKAIWKEPGAEGLEVPGTLVYLPNDARRIKALCFKIDKGVDASETPCDWRFDIELVESCKPDIFNEFAEIFDEVNRGTKKWLLSKSMR